MASKKRTTRSGPGAGDGEASLVRLNKYLADNGIASRRHADRLIEEGEVMVDGEIVTELGRKIDPTSQRVEVDGVVLRAEGERHNYYLLNKPSGVVCTNDPREPRPRAIDLIGDRKKGRIFPVGRLDEETVGLLILTNDGDFANRLSHPRYQVPKTYTVQVDGWIPDEALDALREGVRLSGVRAELDEVRLLERGERSTLVQVTLREGKNREVRRVFARIGFEVRKLRRTAIGPLKERGLKVGHWRPLTRPEIEALLDTSDASATAPARPRRTARSPAQKARAGGAGKGARGPGSEPTGGRSGSGRSAGASPGKPSGKPRQPSGGAGKPSRKPAGKGRPGAGGGPRTPRPATGRGGSSERPQEKGGGRGPQRRGPERRGG